MAIIAAKPPVDPYKLTGKDERQYRRDNPTSDYSKEKEMRYINQISQGLKNNTGVAAPQVDEFKRLSTKWNVNPNATPQFDQNAYLKQQQDQVNSIYNNQTASRTAQFNAERDKAMGLVNQQKAKVAPQYAGMRNQADVVNAQNVSKLREMMAANGISASGENVTANVGLQSARQGALSQLNLQEQETNNDFDRQITDINNPERLNAMISELEAQRSMALMQAGNRADDVGYGRSRDSLMDGRYADETQYGREQDTKQWDYQTNRDAIGDGRYNKEWDYQVGRDGIGDKRYDTEWNYQLKRDGIADNRYNAKNSGGGGSGGYYGGGGSSAPSAKLPANPTGPKIMTEQQYIDAYEEPNARYNGTARVIPGSSDYAKKMQRLMSDLYK